MQKEKIEIQLVDPSSQADELLVCKEIRRIVFTEGQGIPAEADNDGLDSSSFHVLARLDDNPVGTARMREVDGNLRLERIATLNEARGKGIGLQIVKFMTDLAVLAEIPEINMHAQAYLKNFYGRLGYQVRGEEYDEVGIPHIEMFLRP